MGTLLNPHDIVIQFAAFFGGRCGNGSHSPLGLDTPGCPELPGHHTFYRDSASSGWTINDQPSNVRTLLLYIHFDPALVTAYDRA
jgi:hypothetical protein